MQAIQTRFLGPTNVRGSRYKAIAQAGSLTLDADHRLNPEDNHRAVAEAFARKLKWLDHNEGLVGGQLPGGDYAWVFVR